MLQDAELAVCIAARLFGLVTYLFGMYLAPEHRLARAQVGQ